jgi:hypothetical protein
MQLVAASSDSGTKLAAIAAAEAVYITDLTRIVIIAANKQPSNGSGSSSSSEVQDRAQLPRCTRCC